MRPPAVGRRHNGGVSETTAHVVRSRRVRTAAMPFVVAILLALVASLVVFPARTYVNQRNLLAARTAEFEAYADRIESLQDQITYLQSAEGIREAIRSQLGYLMPNERRVPMMETPALSTELPGRWPHGLVSTMLMVRGLQAAHDSARDVVLLEPLSP
jgi:cell division protein FtsB